MTLMDLVASLLSIFQQPLEIALTLGEVKVVFAVIRAGLLYPLFLLACHNSPVSCCCADSKRAAATVFMGPAAARQRSSFIHCGTLCASNVHLSPLQRI